MAQVSHRDRLIRGAMTCLRTKGYARTTARDIAIASNANLASISYHFGSKEALLNEALIKIFEERTARLDEITSSDDDTSPREHLTATFSAVLKMFEANRPLLVAFLEAIAESDRSDELRARMAEHYRHTRRAVAERIRAAFGPAADKIHSDPTTFASFIIATLDGLVIQWLLDSNDTPTAEQLIASLQETTALLRGP